MNTLTCRKPNDFGSVVRTAAALFLAVSCTVFDYGLAQAHPSKAEAVTFPSNTQIAIVKAQMPYKKRLEGTIDDNMVADNRTRALVQHIHADQIASIQFTDLLYGSTVLSMPTKDPNQVPVHPYFDPTVSDRHLITRFLKALHHAYMMKGATVALATPSLRITFRRRGRFQRGPLDIDINFAFLGPEFQSALNKIPSYLAAQLHHKMQTLGGQVREVDFATSKATDPQKIAQIIRALKHVKPKAFSVYGDTRDTLGLNLLLRQGRPKEVVFVIDPALLSRSGTSVLPEPLYAYITGRKSARN